MPSPREPEPPEPELPDPRAEPDPAPPVAPAEAAEEHDPTGLELARQVARRVRASKPTTAAQPPRRRRRFVDPQSSGAHPDDRDPQLVGDAVSHLFDHLGWDREVNVHLLMGRWAEFVGASIADHSQPESYTDQVLTVRTDSTSWATELRLQQSQILAVLNRALGEGSVLRLQIKGPGAPSWSHGRRSIRGARGPRDTYG